MASQHELRATVSNCAGGIPYKFRNDSGDVRQKDGRVSYMVQPRDSCSESIERKFRVRENSAKNSRREKLANDGEEQRESTATKRHMVKGESKEKRTKRKKGEAETDRDRMADARVAGRGR